MCMHIYVASVYSVYTPVTSRHSLRPNFQRYVIRNLTLIFRNVPKKHVPWRHRTYELRLRNHKCSVFSIIWKRP